MKEIKVNATKSEIEEFKRSPLWHDIMRELSSWKRGFNQEMLTIVDDAATGNPSTASILLHMGDLNGRQKAVDYMLGLLDIFLNILEDEKMDATKPFDIELLSMLPYWIRQTRSDVNSLFASISPSAYGIVVTDLTIAAGATALSVGVNLSPSFFEVVFAGATGPANIANIYSGVAGQKLKAERAYFLKYANSGDVTGDKILLSGTWLRLFVGK